MKEYVQLLNHFYEPLKSDLPIRVIFKVKIRRKKTEIALHKFSHNDYFTCDLENLLKYYNSGNSAWIKFNYVGGKNVDIRVKYLNLVEVNYPYPNTTNINVDRPYDIHTFEFLNTIVDLDFPTIN